MKLIMTIQTKDVQLCLDERRCIAWTDNNDLLEKFFPALETLLAEQDVTLQDVTDVALHVDIPRGYMTARIAQTIVRTLRFGLGLSDGTEDIQE